LLTSLDVGAARCAQIEHIQRLLMQCSATLAGSTNPDNHIADDDIERMEQEIDAMQAKLPALRGFIIAGGGVEASQCHVARTVCRRAERRCVALNDDASGAQGNILRLLNRLSDYLFVLARVLCIEKGDGKEKFWDGKQKK
jgi:cob(I)alamin adenosyltransferase